MDYSGRLRRARERMKQRDIGMMFLIYGADLWYLAGVRRVPLGLTDTHSHGDYICGAYIGAESGFTLLVSRLGGAFYRNEVDDKPWVEEVRPIDESENPKAVLLEVVKSTFLEGKGV